MEPTVIRKLDEATINRIAAGEVIQRPANALKEMIENSLDAKSTNITVTVKQGGLKYLQIQDNGTGIRKEDLPIVCERFTTSKLQKFEDLTTISTYGFRGEALASISHVAHLTILTKTRNEKCAFKASYADGKLKEPPKPCAGNQGTQITVEDLFYNMPTRKNALKNPNDEYQKIFDVISKYAIHNAPAGFSLKKFGEKNDLKTPIASSNLDNIRIIHGNNIAKELLEIKCSDDKLRFHLKGLISNANFSTKKPQFILFINHRLVDSSLLRKTLDLVYTAYLPKGSHPFIYLSLEIDPKSCDVNVHPTKHEVNFLNEELIIEKIKSEIEKKLLGSNVSRTLYVQTRLPNVSEPKAASQENDKVHDKNLVRTDNKEQKIQQYFGAPTSKKHKFLITQHVNKKDKIEVRLLSVIELRKHIENKCNANIRDIFAQLKFVGIISTTQSIIQYTTKLFLCNTQKLSEELFYQFIIYDFQNFDEIKFESVLSIFDLVKMALELTNIEYNPEVDGTPDEVANTVKEILIAKSALLSTYFALNIDDAGNLLSIPRLLKNYMPDLSNLPLYLLRLATEVNWDSEKECFETFARQTAIFYAHISTNSDVSNESIFEWNWVVEHVLYVALKQYFLPDESIALNGYLTQIANLPDLYKVFERC